MNIPPHTAKTALRTAFDFARRTEWSDRETIIAARCIASHWLSNGHTRLSRRRVEQMVSAVLEAESAVKH